MCCEDIFSKAGTIKDKTIEVTFSMLEIYSEKVRDLLDSNAERKSGLLIREDPKIGFYRKLEKIFLFKNENFFFVYL